jgi:hypothetical protein
MLLNGDHIVVVVGVLLLLSFYSWLWRLQTRGAHTAAMLATQFKATKLEALL